MPPMFPSREKVRRPYSQSGPQLYKKGINNPYKYMAGKAHGSFTFFFCKP